MELVNRQQSESPGNGEWADDEAIEITCPGCNADLTSNPLFERFRLCESCGRHFWLPARERLELLVDPGTFRETNSEVASVDPLQFQDVSSRRPISSEIEPVANSLITGTAQIGGCDTVVIIADFAMVGDSIGYVAGEKLLLAIELAAHRRVPIISITSDGPKGSGDEIISAIQSLRIANAFARSRSNGVPYIAILSHPSTGSLFHGVASHADLMFSEPGSSIGTSLAGQPTGPVGSTEDPDWENWFIDATVSRRRHRDQIIGILDILTSRAAPRIGAALSASEKSSLTGSEELDLARDPGRPSALDLLDGTISGFIEFGEDSVADQRRAIKAGIGEIDGVSVAAIAVGGTAAHPLTPRSLVLIQRLIQFASLTELPLISFLSGEATRRNHPEIDASLSAQVARLAELISGLNVPTVAILSGEVHGRAPLSLAIADRVLMLEHGVLSAPIDPVHQPIGSASSPSARNRTVMTSRECRRLGLVDRVIPEPEGGAHEDLGGTLQNLRLSISHSLGEVSNLGPKGRQDRRTKRLRNLGSSSATTIDRIRVEMDQLQELQIMFERSLGDIRHRVDAYQRQLPELPSRPGMPEVIRGSLPNLPEFRRPGVARPEITDIRTRISSTRRELSDRLSEVKGNTETSDTPGLQDRTEDEAKNP